MVLQRLPLKLLKLPEKLAKRVTKLSKKWADGDRMAFALYLVGCWPIIALAASALGLGLYCVRSLISGEGFHDIIGAVLFVFAQLAGKELNGKLKRTFPQARPERSGKAELKGMPSYHAQSSFFLASYSVVGHPWLCWRVASLILLAFGVSYSRVYLGMHTPAQVFAGGIVGVSLGLIVGLIGCTEMYGGLLAKPM